MKSNRFVSSTLLALTLSMTATSCLALASEGGTSSGGGDLCEDRIKVIRDDLRSWIEKGGPAGLTLPAEVSALEYSKSMTASIDSAKIRCVSSQDPGFPVMVNGTPKVCRFDQNGAKSQITCDAAKFAALDESDQYILVHHEYAGLAGEENPNGDDSHYEISNQISGFLVDQVVKKLAIAPQRLKPCFSLDQSKPIPVGTKCITTKGAVFERVTREGFNEAWMDPQGLVWSDKIGWTNQSNAIELCKKLGGTLPSDVAFAHGKATGFGEVLSNMPIYEDRQYWTSSDYSYVSDSAYVFSTYYGFSSSDNRNNEHYVRCIAR